MYKLTVVNQFGNVSVLKGDDLDRLKVIAKRLNANGCDVEITQEQVIYRVVNLNN